MGSSEDEKPSETLVPVQLGFAVSINSGDEEAVGHRSPNWNNWDGGKLGGIPSWLNPRDLPPNPIRCKTCAGNGEVREQRNGTDDQEQHVSLDHSKCGPLMKFVAQLYCPADVETGNDGAFHRSLYVFVCPRRSHNLATKRESMFGSGGCGGVRVLRCQMERVNEFYPSSCVSECEKDTCSSWMRHHPKTWNVNVCKVCGQRSSGKCPKQNEFFCCKEHQKEHLKYLHQKLPNGVEDDVKCLPSVCNEMELVVEEEPEEDVENCDPDEARKQIERSFRDISIRDEGAENEDDDARIEQQDLNQMAGVQNGTIDPKTVEFYTRIGRGENRNQCLRYDRWNDAEPPLWVSEDCSPNDDEIPRCERCGAERKFEFQILPQMLFFLGNSGGNGHGKSSASASTNDSGRAAVIAAATLLMKADETGVEPVDAITRKRVEANVANTKEQVLSGGKSTEDDMDWGTISVYTCTKSCGGGEADEINGKMCAYRDEFAWRQPPLC